MVSTINGEGLYNRNTFSLARKNFNETPEYGTLDK